MAQPLLAPRFNFGMGLDMPATPSAAPPTLQFNFGMNSCIPGVVLPLSLALHTLQPFNLGFTLPLPAQQPAPKLFNMGFNLPVQSTGTPLPTMLSPTTSQPFNLGFNLPIAVTTPATSFGLVLAQADTSRHIGYDINNRFWMQASLTHCGVATVTVLYTPLFILHLLSSYSFVV
ncbi:hypothetical protein BDR07DRAFT_1480810 [Suillus spraguei]|nr:hypothetical protein BDR07DRAFT_1480810 [Suillus spraguei]